MDFLSFVEIHVKPVSVFYDWLIGAQWNQIRDDGIRDRAAVCEAKCAKCLSQKGLLSIASREQEDPTENFQPSTLHRRDALCF
jgi:hypothetical protein